MATCDICSATMEMDEAAAYTIDELQELIRRGFGPPDKVVRMALAAGWTREQVIARWQQELEARPQPYWMLCPACAKRAFKAMPDEETPAEAPAPLEEKPASAAALPTVRPLAPAALSPAESPEESPAAEETIAPGPGPDGKRPRTGRTLLIGLLIGLLGGVAFYGLILDRALHSTQPTPVAPTAVVEPSPTAQPTKPRPTSRPATPRPTEALFPPTVISLPNLSAVALTLDDMPAGFREMPASRQETLGFTEELLAPAFSLAQGRLRQLGTLDYRRTGELVVSFLVYPLTPEELAAFDRGLANADAGLPALWAALSKSGWSVPTRGDRLEGVGENGLRLSSTGSGDAAGLLLEVLVARRGAVLEFVLVGYQDGAALQVDPVEIVRLLDTRLARQIPLR
jgi:hypothetical protein